MLVGMHITRLPEVREAILQESFQHFKCPSCQFINRVEKQSIYTDFEHQHYVAVELPMFDNWREKVKLHREAFDQSFSWGPPMTQQMGRSMLTRLVFGLRALREKLLIWDAGFDDRVIEIGKREILKRTKIDTNRFFLRLLAVQNPSMNLFLGLFERPKSKESALVNSRMSLPEPVDTLTVFHQTVINWHSHSVKLIDQNPWARRAWFVDAIGA